MICERCQQKVATVHMQQIVNNEKIEMHVCAECAAGLEMPISFENIFQGFLDSFMKVQNSDRGKAERLPVEAASCPLCGLTYEGFKRTGRLGCAQCYKTFAQELSAIFKNVQSSNQHQGKFPKKSGAKLMLKREVDNLKLSLAKAIENEQYEEAAKLRDHIREIEREGVF